MSVSDKHHPGYAFLPVADKVDRRERPQASHGRYREDSFSGTLGIAWLAEQPIHIGSGFKALVGDKQEIVRQTVRLGDVPCIPGSTLKGVLRARYEAITYSCVVAPKLEKTKVRSSSFPGAKARILPVAIGPAPFSSGKSCMCPTCSLFGRLDLRSRLIVTDALPDSLATERREIPAQFGPNLHHIGDFNLNPRENVLDVHHLHGRKFAVGRDNRPPPGAYSKTNAPFMQTLEVIPEGSHLRSEVRFLNLDLAELGGLCAALGIAPRSRLKVGGGKSHGLGRLYPEEVAPTLRSPDSGVFELSALEAAFRNDAACHVDNLDALASLHGQRC